MGNINEQRRPLAVYRQLFEVNSKSRLQSNLSNEEQCKLCSSPWKSFILNSVEKEELSATVVSKHATESEMDETRHSHAAIRSVNHHILLTPYSTRGQALLGLSFQA